MAYSIGKTSALQTAIKAGVDIALAEYASGALVGSIMDRIHEVADELKVELFAQADADNAAMASSPRPSGGGFNRNSGGNSGPVSLDDAKAMVLNFGWAKGLTIGDVLVMNADETLAFSGGKYKRSGVDYIRWMSQNKDPKGAFAAARAKVAIDDYDVTGAQLTKLAG